MIVEILLWIELALLVGISLAINIDINQQNKCIKSYERLAELMDKPIIMDENFIPVQIERGRRYDRY